MTTPTCTTCGKAPCACALDLDAVEARCNAAYHREVRFPRGDGTFGVLRPRVCCVSHAAIERDVGALVREVRRLRAENESVRATWRHMVEHTNDPNTPDEWVAAEARRVFADDGTAGREWREVHEEVRRLREALADPEAVRANILRGAIAVPPDLVWLHDTNGPVAALREALANPGASAEVTCAHSRMFRRSGLCRACTLDELREAAIDARKEAWREVAALEGSRVAVSLHRRAAALDAVAGALAGAEVGR